MNVSNFECSTSRDRKKPLEDGRAKCIKIIKKIVKKLWLQKLPVGCILLGDSSDQLTITGPRIARSAGGGSYATECIYLVKSHENSTMHVVMK